MKFNLVLFLRRYMLIPNTCVEFVNEKLCICSFQLIEIDKHAFMEIAPTMDKYMVCVIPVTSTNTLLYFSFR